MSRKGKSQRYFVDIHTAIYYSTPLRMIRMINIALIKLFSSGRKYSDGASIAALLRDGDDVFISYKPSGEIKKKANTAPKKKVVVSPAAQPASTTTASTASQQKASTASDGKCVPYEAQHNHAKSPNSM